MNFFLNAKKPTVRIDMNPSVSFKKSSGLFVRMPSVTFGKPSFILCFALLLLAMLAVSCKTPCGCGW